MTNNQILTASFLDILFENRNKDYGAYSIRKAYPTHLKKAIGLMLLLVTALSLFVKSRPNKEQGNSFPPIHDTLIVKLDPYQEKQKPKEPEPQRSVPEQPPTQLDRPIVIVDNPDPNKLPPDRTDTTIVNPGATNNLGTGGDPNYIQGVVSGTTDITQNPVEPTPLVEEPSILSVAEVQPEFPGGAEAWRKYLEKMLRVPDDLEAGERKTVRVRFVVNADGDVTDVIVLQGAGIVFDKEVLRVIAKMPKWKPGKQHGKAVAVYFTQPVTFKGPEE